MHAKPRREQGDQLRDARRLRADHGACRWIESARLARKDEGIVAHVFDAFPRDPEAHRDLERGAM